jgi:DNA-binding PadR family transcriptional regulator
MEKSTQIKPAKMCFEHIGGKLGMLLMETFASKGWIAKHKPDDKHFYITEEGEKEFTKLGLDLSQIKSETLEG